MQYNRPTGRVMRLVILPIKPLEYPTQCWAGSKSDRPDSAYIEAFRTTGENVKQGRRVQLIGDKLPENPNAPDAGTYSCIFGLFQKVEKSAARNVRVDSTMFYDGLKAWENARDVYNPTSEDRSALTPPDYFITEGTEINGKVEDIITFDSASQGDSYPLDRTWTQDDVTSNLKFYTENVEPSKQFRHFKSDKVSRNLNRHPVTQCELNSNCG